MQSNGLPASRKTTSGYAETEILKLARLPLRHKPYLTDEVSGDAYDAIGRDKRVPPIRGIRLLGRDALIASADRPDGYAIVI